MIEYEETKIRHYENFIRDIVNSVVLNIDFEKLENKKQTFLSKTKERFLFDNENGWKFLTSALDTIGDSNFAIIVYLNSKNEDKSTNSGIEYLKLYGVLSAIYIQQQSILKLLELFKINNLNAKKKEFEVLEITFLRHCISAHPINYNLSGEKVSFKIVRTSLYQVGKVEVCDQTNSFKTYDIFKAIETYKSIAENMMKIISEKLIENIYKSAENKMEELKNKLSLIK